MLKRASAFAEATADRVGWRLDRHFSLPPVRDYSRYDKVLTSIYLDKNWLQYRGVFECPLR